MGTSHSKDDFKYYFSTHRHNILNMNIQCDAPPPPPPAPVPPPPPSSDSTQSTTSSSSSQQPPDTFVSSIPNPGPYEHAIMPAKSLLSLDTHDGFRMEIQKQLSPFMVIMHNFSLGTTFPDGSNKSYSFLTQVADENGVIMTSFDPYRQNVTGRIIQSILGGIGTLKLQTSISPDGSNDSLLGEVDLNAMTWSSNFKYGSMGGGLIFGMNYYQSVTKRLAMGGEGMYVSANGNLMNSYTLKYEMPAPDGAQTGNDDNGEQDAISKAVSSTGGRDDGNISSKPSSWFLAQLNPAQGMLNLYYKRVVTPNRVTLGAELMVVPTLETQLTFGGEFKLERSKVALTVDGTGKIQSVLETKIGMAPGSPTLSLNAEVDHGKDSMKFGYGFNVGS